MHQDQSKYKAKAISAELLELNFSYGETSVLVTIKFW